MCDCIKVTSDKLRAKATESDFKKPRGANQEPRFSIPKNQAISFSTGKTVLLIPFELSWDIPGKGMKGTDVNIEASHCPFCGVKFQP